MTRKFELIGSQETVRKKAEESFWYFCSYILGYDWAHEPLHKKICDHAQDGCHKPYDELDSADKQWTLLLAPRDGGKTTFFTGAHAIWVQLLAEEDGYPMSIGMAHALKPKAAKMLGDVKWHWEANEKLKWIAPRLAWKDPYKEAHLWTKTEFSLQRKKYAREPSYTAFSLEASQVMMHFDVIYLDDIVIDVTSDSPVVREKVRRFFSAAPALLKGLGWKKIMVAGTRWDPDDQYGLMLAKDSGWEQNLKPLVIDCYTEDGKSVWPRGLPMKTLKQLEKSDEWMFSCLYRNNPLPKGLMAFDESHVGRYVTEFWEGKPSLPQEIRETRVVSWFTAVDPNVTETEGNDPAAVMTACLDSEGDVWVVDLVTGHPSPSELIDWCREQVQTYQPETLFFETVGAFQTFLHWFDHDSVKSGVIYPIEPVKRPPSSNKVARIMKLGPLMRLGKLHVPRGEKFEPLMREIRCFSRHRKKNQDDCLDTLADIFNLGTKPEPTVARVEPPHDPYLLKRLVDPRGFYEDSGMTGVQEDAYGALSHAQATRIRR